MSGAPDDRRRDRRPPGGEPGGEPVLDRAVRLLSSFDGTGALSLTQLSARTGLSKSTALRLARRLTELGMLQRRADGRFVIGLRLWEIASLAPHVSGLRATALPYLHGLQLATGQHVLLAVRDGHEAVVIEHLPDPAAGPAPSWAGGRLPLHTAAVGLALLAHAPGDVQQQVLDRARPSSGDGGTHPDEDLRRSLARVRLEGFAQLRRRQTGATAGVASVAAPVFGTQRRIVAAVSAAGSQAPLQPSVVTPAVVSVARAISEALGTAADFGGPGTDG